MPDDVFHRLQSVERVEVYDRRDVERYLAEVEACATALRQRLDDAARRRAEAERSRAAAATRSHADLLAALRRTSERLDREQEELDRTGAELRQRSAREARRVLEAAQDEALGLQEALERFVRRPAGGSSPDPGTRPTGASARSIAFDAPSWRTAPPPSPERRLGADRTAARAAHPSGWTTVTRATPRLRLVADPVGAA